MLEEEGVIVLAADLDNDSGRFFVAAGVPYRREDDEGLMLRAMRQVVDTSLPLVLQIGINRGHVFAAEVGSVWRASCRRPLPVRSTRSAATLGPGTVIHGAQGETRDGSQRTLDFLAELAPFAAILNRATAM